jgi:hypothetical protein
MPESKTDQAHRSNKEISDFFECGDARGPEWLDSHPDDRARADQHLIDLRRDEPLAPQQRRPQPSTTPA